MWCAKTPILWSMRQIRVQRSTAIITPNWATTHLDSWYWSGDRDGSHRGDRQRQRFSKRKRFGGMGRHGSTRALHRWQAKAAGHQKRGNNYLRRLFVQGARTVMQHRLKQSPGLSCWLAQLLSRTHQQVAVVALANKLLRIAWAVLCKNEAYRAPVLAMSS